MGGLVLPLPGRLHAAYSSSCCSAAAHVSSRSSRSSCFDTSSRSCAARSRRPALRPADRAFLAAASRLMPRTRWPSFFVTPGDAAALASPARGAPLDLPEPQPGSPADRCRGARARPAAGAREPALGLSAHRGRARQARIACLRDERAQAPCSRPGSDRPDSAAGFAGASSSARQAQSMVACDFFTVETVSLRRYLRALLHRAFKPPRAPRRRDRATRTGPGSAQQARNLAGRRPRARAPLRFLIHDRDAKFTPPSTRSSAPKASRWSGRRSGRQRRTLSPSASSARCARSASTGS